MDFLQLELMVFVEFPPKTLIIVINYFSVHQSQLQGGQDLDLCTRPQMYNIINVRSKMSLKSVRPLAPT